MKKLLLSVLIPILISFSCNTKSDDGLPSNNVVIAWNNMAVTIADQHDQFLSFIGIRALTMAHVAMNDALNAIRLRYVPYAFNGQKPGADATAACTEAAFVVLSEIYPDRLDTLQEERRKWIDPISESNAKKAGIELGRQSAQAILQLRKGDGHETNVPYTPRNMPGAYQYVPGFPSFVFNTDLDKNKAFALQKPDQFRVPPPPALNSGQYAIDFNEVKDYGVAGSKLRTTDQTNYAHWWAEFGEHGWNRIGRITAAQNKLPIHETARLFALINMTVYDLYIAVLDSKYHYDTWRPITAIKNADMDNNPATTADTSWQPEMQTPPFPEYPSGHSAVGSAGAAVAAHVFGTKNVSFEMESTMALPHSKTRKYTNLDSAANDCARSRVLNGYHFRFSAEVGKEQGKQIAEYILTSMLKPVANN